MNSPDTIIIKGNYYDGKHSKPFAVTVFLQKEQLEIVQSQDAQNMEHRIIWPINQIENSGFSSSNQIQLTYGIFPAQLLDINQKKDVRQFEAFYANKFDKLFYQKALKGNINKVIGGLFLLLPLIIVLYFSVVIPVITEKAIAMVPQSTEISIGNTLANALMDEETINCEKSAILTDFYYAFGFESSYPIEVFYDDSETVNAFAIPGGKIVVYQGIIEHINTWQELAGLLGHELAHIEKRHTLKHLSRKLSTYLILSVATGDVLTISTILTENAMQLYDYSHSRSAEREADEEGMKYLLANNIDPKGMIGLFEALNAYEKEKYGERSSKPKSELFRTHPLTKRRIDYMQKAAEQHKHYSFPANAQASQLFEQLKN